MKKNCFTIIGICLLTTTFSQAPTSWQSHGIGGGGALFSPSINPANHNEIYVACDMSELFHTTNSGQTWGELNFTQVQGGHDSYVSFTNNPNILYTVDYTSINGNDMTRPMKSVNGGTTWAPIAADPYASFPGGGMERLIADYNNPNNLILADFGTIYFSNNGGTSFTQIHTNVNSGAGNHIAGVFYDGNNIYIGTNDGLIYSTNGGSSFSTMITTGFGTGTEQMLSFSGAREGSTVRFVCLTADSTNVYADIQYGSSYYQTLVGVYTMDNANGTWAGKMGGINSTTDYPVFCGMANNDIDTMYLAGGSSIGNPIVMKATFSTNWSHVFNSVGNVNIATGWCGQGGPHGWSYAEAPFGFQVCPNSSKIVMFGDYGFAHATTDAGASWHQQYVSVADQNPMNANTPASKYYHGIGLENTTNWQVMWTDALHMYAPFSDITGVMSSDSGKSWNFIPNVAQNSIYRSVKDANTGNIYLATSTVHDMYQSTRIYDSQINGGGGNIYFSTNSGVSFSVLHNFSSPVIWVSLDPSNANRMYAAVANGSTNTGGIYVTNNLSAGAGSTWVKLAKPPRSNGHAFNVVVLNNGDLVASFCARKPTTGSNFTDSSGVYYYDSNLSTWYDRSDVGMHYWTKDVVIDPNDVTQNTWYATVFSGWANVPAGTGGIYKTINKGVNWTQISNSYRVNSVTINPTNANELYFTTETDGLWYSANATNASPTFSQVSSYPFRGPVRVFFNPYKNTEIWVSSFGNGMMMGSIVQSTGTGSQSATNCKQLVIYPNPASETINFKAEGLTEKGKLLICDISGQEINNTDFFNATEINVSSFSSGMYFYHLSTGKKIFAGKFIISR
jgi:photosystem II stability/assembly factor-like uncharacterized protein